MKTKRGNRWYYKGAYEVVNNISSQMIADMYSMFSELKHIQEGDSPKFKLDGNNDIFSKYKPQPMEYSFKTFESSHFITVFQTYNCRHNEFKIYFKMSTETMKNIIRSQSYRFNEIGFTELLGKKVEVDESIETNTIIICADEHA